jgi:hypothetical protein
MAERRARSWLRANGYMAYRSRSSSLVDFIGICPHRSVILLRVNPRPGDERQLAALARSVHAGAVVLRAIAGKPLHVEQVL